METTRMQRSNESNTTGAATETSTVIMKEMTDVLRVLRAQLPTIDRIDLLRQKNAYDTAVILVHKGRLDNRELLGILDHFDVQEVISGSLGLSIKVKLRDLSEYC